MAVYLLASSGSVPAFIRVTLRLICLTCMATPWFSTHCGCARLFRCAYPAAGFCLMHNAYLGALSCYLLAILCNFSNCDLFLRTAMRELLYLPTVKGN